MSSSRVARVSSKLSPNLEGALWMLGSAVMFVAMTALVKYLGSGYSAPLQNLYRQAAALTAMLPFMLRAPKEIFNTERWPLLVSRSFCGSAGVMLQFYTYQTLPMADANALSFTRPLWIVPLAAFVLHEAVGVPRVAAVVVGFLGVMVMLFHPGAHHVPIGLPQGAALLSSLLLALSITGLKALIRHHSVLKIMTWSSLMGVLFSLPFAMVSWRWPSLGDLALLAVMGVLAVINQSFFMKAMSVGDAIAMAPLDYTRLVFSVLVGFFIFHETPSAWTLGGAVVIVAATLSITWREHHLASRAKAAAALTEGGL